MKSAPEMDEGPAAFERFRKAMKTIIGVRKDAVMSERPKARTKKKKATSHKS